MGEVLETPSYKSSTRTLTTAILRYLNWDLGGRMRVVKVIVFKIGKREHGERGNWFLSRRPHSERFWGKTDRPTDRQTNWPTDRQTDRQNDGQTEKEEMSDIIERPHEHHENVSWREKWIGILRNNDSFVGCIVKPWTSLYADVLSFFLSLSLFNEDKLWFSQHLERLWRGPMGAMFPFTTLMT